MISVDPWRDTVGQLRKYVAEFHPRLIGLTGTPEQVTQVSRNYRIYSSKPPEADDEDYLVDHSVFMFLMNPEGNFVRHFGPDKDEEYIFKHINWEINHYKTTVLDPPRGWFSKIYSKFTEESKPAD